MLTVARIFIVLVLINFNTSQLGVFGSSNNNYDDLDNLEHHQLVLAPPDKVVAPKSPAHELSSPLPRNYNCCGFSIHRMIEKTLQSFKWSSPVPERENYRFCGFSDTKTKLSKAVADNDGELVREIFEELKASRGDYPVSIGEAFHNACDEARKLKRFGLIVQMLLPAPVDLQVVDSWHSGLVNISTSCFVAVSRLQDFDCVEYLLKSGILFDEKALSTALMFACEEANLPLMKVLMDYCEQNRIEVRTWSCSGLLCILQGGIEKKNQAAFGIAKRHFVLNAFRQIGLSGISNAGDYLNELFPLVMETSEYQLLEDVLNLFHPTEYTDAEMYLIYLTHFASRPRADFIAMLSNTRLMNIFLNRTENQIRFGGSAVEPLMRRAAEYGLLEFIRSMAERDRQFVYPSQEAFAYAVRQAEAHGHQVIVDYLQPLIPTFPVQAPAVGIANIRARPIHPDGAGLMGIHHFSNAVIQLGASKHMSVKLLDAVYGFLLEKYNVLKAKKCDLMEFDGVRAKLNDWIDEYVCETERAETKKVAFERLVSDSEYESVLTLVVNFIVNFHPNEVERWLAGFITESRSAYNASGISCDRGVRERVAVGLRGIDPDLDRIFVLVEGPMLMANTMKKWNPYGNPGLIATNLLAGGLKIDASADEAATLFISLFSKDVEGNGLSLDQYRNDMTTIAEGIRENYHEISEALKKKENQLN